MGDCLEVARNHRLCAGAQEYERTIAELEATVTLVVATYYDNEEPCSDDIFDDLMVSLRARLDKESGDG